MTIRRQSIMADNYLENQYEKYQARKAAWEKAKKHMVKRPVKHNNSQSESKESQPSKR